MPGNNDNNAAHDVLVDLGMKQIAWWLGARVVLAGSETHHATAFSELDDQRAIFSDRFCNELNQFRSSVHPISFHGRVKLFDDVGVILFKMSTQ